MYLEKVSDLNSSDLVLIRNKEEDQIFELSQLDTQLLPGTIFAATCQVKDVMMRVFLKCSSDAGDRLSVFKKMVACQ